MNNQQPISNHQPLFAIIVAGGSGNRMKSALPKQFLLLGGKPILQHTIERFLAYSATLQVILVLPARELATWTSLCDKHNFYPPIHTVIGGSTRFRSVQNGLKKISVNEGLVAVHDGVRPFVTTDIIRRGFETAAETGSAVTCVSVKDSVRIIQSDGSNQAVDRSQYRLMQTPQTFQLPIFRQAFQSEEQPFFTDCASVVEYAGFPITLIEGSYSNIKLTTPEDLSWAESVIHLQG